MSNAAMRHLMRSPTAFAKFQLTGQMPRTFRPASPLITLLEKLTPRERVALRGVKVGPSLGYSGMRQFHTAEQAYRWCKPSDEVVESVSFPAESWRLKNFHKELTVRDLLACSSGVPDSMSERYAPKVDGIDSKTVDGNEGN